MEGEKHSVTLRLTSVHSFFLSATLLLPLVQSVTLYAILLQVNELEGQGSIGEDRRLLRCTVFACFSISLSRFSLSLFSSFLLQCKRNGAALTGEKR